MHFPAEDALILVGLLTAAIAMLAAADVFRVPYPIVLVVGGLAIGFVPGMPHIELDPDLVLIAILPPLLYGAAYFTSLRELRTNIKPISLLAIGLVLLTALFVAAVAHHVVGLSWPAAFVLGAIVSPTDPIAATAVAERLGLPRGLVGLIEGESLVNDGTALVAYRFAVAAVVTGSFSLLDASGRFVLNVVGGILVGIAVGWVIRRVRLLLDNPPLEITIALASGYFGYLPAEVLGVSGVLAAVTVGVYMGWHTPELTDAQTRLQGAAVWEIAFFILNALLFMLIGLQLPEILDQLGDRPWTTLVGYGAVIFAAVVGARLVWVFATLWAARFRTWRESLVITWSGLRGAVSLAAALALPLSTDAGDPFPDRDLIVFLTFCVICATLVIQGLTLPALIRALRLEDDGQEAHEEAKARIHAAEAALARLEELAEEDWARDDTVDRIRGVYGFRRDRFRSRLDVEADDSLEERSLDYQRLRRELLDAERASLLELRRTRRIDDAVYRRVSRDLDLEDARLDL